MKTKMELLLTILLNNNWINTVKTILNLCTIVYKMLYYCSKKNNHIQEKIIGNLEIFKRESLAP